MTGWSNFLPPTTLPGYNAVVGKLNANLEFEWVKIYGGNDDDVPVAICTTADGGFGVAVSTMSTTDVAVGNHGSSDILLLRLDSAGNLKWSKVFGGSAGEEPFALTATSDGGFAVVATTNSNDGDVPFQYVNSQFTIDWVMVKTDSLGNKQWSKTLGGTGDETGLGGLVSAGDGIYLTAASTSRNGECTDTAWHPGVYTGQDVFLIKLDLGGNVLWNKSFGSTSSELVFTAFFDHRDSTVLIGAMGANDFHCTGSHGHADGFLIKADQAGNLIWTRVMGDGAEDRIYSIAPAADGGYLATGYHWHNPAQPGNIGLTDFWIFAVDSNGGVLKQKKFGGLRADVAEAIFPVGSGYVVAGGTGSAGFTEGTNTGQNTTSSNKGYMFFSKLEYWPLSTETFLQEERDGLKVYPNPAGSNVQVMLLAQHKGGRLHVYSAMGRLHYSKEVSKLIQEVAVPLDGLAAGQYSLLFTDVDGVKAAATFVHQP